MADNFQSFVDEKAKALQPGMDEVRALRAQRADEEASRKDQAATEARKDYPLGPDITRYNYPQAAADGNLPEKGAPAEQFDPRYAVPEDPRTVDQKAADVALPSLLYGMGVRGSVPPPSQLLGPETPEAKRLERASINSLAKVVQESLDFAYDVTGVKAKPPEVPSIGATLPGTGEVLPITEGERFATDMTQLAIANLALRRVTSTMRAPMLVKEVVADALTGLTQMNPEKGETALTPKVLEWAGVEKSDVTEAITAGSTDKLVGRIMNATEFGSFAPAFKGIAKGAQWTKSFAEGLAEGLVSLAKGELKGMTPGMGAAEAGNISFHVQPGQTVSTRIVDPITEGQRAKGLPERVESGEILTLRTGLDAMLKPGGEKAFAKNMATFDDIITSFVVDPALPPLAKFHVVTRGMADNLLWLHDNYPWRERAAHWYPGGNRLTHELANKHGVTHEQSSAVMATQSPQKDWFMNVDLARRIHEGFAAGNTLKWKWTPAMRAWTKQYLKDSEATRLKEATKLFQKGELTDVQFAKRIAYSSKKLKEDTEGFARAFKHSASELDKARWIRAWDQTSNPRTYNVLSPEGASMGPAMNADGITTSGVAWGDFRTIGKGVSVLEDGSMANISAQLGNEHKVRNFYNNIIDPLDPTNVTSDTHQVAAAHLQPFSGKSAAVKHNFGGGVGASASKETGASGTYGVYHESVNIAAKERDVLPLSMQSISWEAIRSLFGAEQKSTALTAQVSAVWKQVQAGTITREEGMQEIHDLVGGFTPPAWSKQ